MQESNPGEIFRPRRYRSSTGDRGPAARARCLSSNPPRRTADWWGFARHCAAGSPESFPTCAAGDDVPLMVQALPPLRRIFAIGDADPAGEARRGWAAALDPWHRLAVGGLAVPQVPFSLSPRIRCAGDTWPGGTHP